MVYEQQKNKIYKTSFLFLFICFAIIFVIPTANAGIGDFPQVMCDSINNGVVETITDIFSPDNEFFTSMTATKSGTMVAGISKLMKGVAGFIIIIISMVHLFQELNRGKDGVEAVLRMLMELFITMFIVMQLDKLLGYIVQIGVVFITDVSDLVTDTKFEGITLKKITGKSSGGIIWWIQSFAILIVPYIFSLLFSLVAQFMAFSILIEIGIRRAFAPIPVCFIYGEGLRSPGARYLLRFLAVFIKICICLAVCGLEKELINAALDDSTTGMGMGECLTYIFTTVAVNLTGVGVMAKGGEYANEIVGT